jgi:hypothetical protein
VTAPGKAIVRIDDAAIKERMRGLLADAWDEGYSDGLDYMSTEVVTEPDNPYRDEASA